MSGKAVLENVRRYRAIASLYRQTAAFRPPQRFSLLEQAKEWERLALAELESYFSTPRGSKYLCEQKEGMAAAGVQLGTPSERFSIALRSRSASPVSDLIGRDALMNGHFAPIVLKNSAAQLFETA